LKLLLHIFWNILAVLTIFILFFGCIFILFGTAGKDLISVVSFLVSDKNLNQEEPIFFGQVKNYLSKCINGNGDISYDIFGDIDSMDNIDKLRNAANEINNITEDMEYLKANPRAYKDYKEDYENRINYTMDNFELIN
jgi:deoxyadenosine/deoxycytidine kinase